MDQLPVRELLRQTIRRLRWWHGLILVLVVACGFGMGALVRPADRSKALAPVSYSGQVGVPGQLLLPSMRERPVPGWRLDLARYIPDINRPSIELVGHIGEIGYFSVTFTGRTTGLAAVWLVAADVRTGTTPFAPVLLEGAEQVECFLNGKNRIFCRSAYPSGEAPNSWVVDARNGTVQTGRQSYLHGRETTIAQAGQYAVVYEPGTGWRGVGEQGELTWTVGAVDDQVGTMAPRPGELTSDLAVVNMDADRSAVIRAADGKILRRTGGRFELVVGGFVEQERRPSTGGRGIVDKFVFFDDNGERVGRFSSKDTGPQLVGGTPLPVFSLLLTDQLLIFDSRGTQMAVLDTVSPSETRFAGERLFVSTLFGDQAWEVFDLRTGERIATCGSAPLDRNSYIGSDGTVVIGRLSEDSPVQAVDTDTCAVLWEIDTKAPMWTVGATLLQALPEKPEIISLVPARR